MNEKKRLFLARTFQKMKEAEDRKERPEMEEDAEVIASIPYGEIEGQALTLYIPRNIDAPCPLICDIHGGAWVYGDENLNRAYDLYLSSKGFAVASIGYRLIDRTDLPGMLSDVTDAIDFLHASRREYGIGTDRIGITGDSAGAHLALFITALKQKEDLRELYGLRPVKPEIAALVLSHPVCELDDMNASRNKRFSMLITEEIRKMFTGLEDPTESPLWGHISWSETGHGVDLPPCLINSSMRDTFYENTKKVMAFMDGEGMKYERHVWGDNYRRLGHIFSIVHPDWKESMMTNDGTAAFFARYLKGGED